LSYHHHHHHYYSYQQISYMTESSGVEDEKSWKVSGLRKLQFSTTDVRKFSRAKFVLKIAKDFHFEKR